MKDAMDLGFTAIQIIVTGVLGWYASRIARNQLWVNRNKLRLDLYDKRYALYVAFLDFIRKVAGDAKISTADLFSFHAQTKEAFFLMPETYPYMEEVFQKANRFRFLNERICFLNNRTVGQPLEHDADKRHGYIDEETQILVWFSDQFEASKRIFSKYLSFPEGTGDL